MTENKRSMIFKASIIVICVFLFILLNSSQERYVSLDQISETTLETIQTTTTNSTSIPYTDTTLPPPDESNYTNSINSSPPETGGRFNLPPSIIPVIISVVILCLVGFLLLQRKNAQSSFQGALPRPIVSGGTARREVFKSQIVTLVDILSQYLDDGKYSEGIIFGYHTIDKNMKRLLGIKRDSYLTPKEFALSLELPEIIPYLKENVSIFYLARYKLAGMGEKDLNQFISNLQAIQKKSITKTEIEINQSGFIEENEKNE